MSEVDPLDYLAAWHADHVDSAAEHGVTLAFSRSDGDHPKTAAWITGKRGDHEAQLIVWSRREAEFAAGARSNPTANEHHELRTITELGGLLDRFLASLGLSQL